MKASIYVNGIIGVDCGLIDVIRQIKSYDKPNSVDVVINSVGGSVSEGQAIFTYLRNLKIPIKTIAEKAYSVASVIFMAGDERLVEAGERKLMIHNPWASVEGGADRLESIAGQLRKIEEQFTDFYSTYTNIDRDSIKTLLKNETFLSGDEAVQMGFATDVVAPVQAVALVGDSLEDFQDEETKMNTAEKFESKMNTAEKIYSELKKLFTIMEKDNKETEIKALIVQDANGVEINFNDVEEGNEPQIGDVAIVDGVPAEGEYTAPSGDVWVFEAGELKEVKPFEAPVEEEAPEAEAESEAEPSLEELIKKLVGLEEGMAALEAKQIEREAEIVALKESFEAMKGTNDELVQVKAELQALKELVGSEDLDVQAKETKTNQKTKNGLIDIFRN